MKEQIVAAEKGVSSIKSLSDPSSAAGASFTGAVVAVSAESLGARVGRYRWVICGLLFFATTINYVDRQVLGILSKDLQSALGWNELQYGNIVAAFNAAYALGLLGAGRLMDRFGTKIGYSLALTVWSLAAMSQKQEYAVTRQIDANGAGTRANRAVEVRVEARYLVRVEFGDDYT